MTKEFNLEERSKKSVEKIIETMKKGDLPKSLANIFIHRNENIPSNNWSINNRLIMLLNETFDARSYKAWKSVGRVVSGKDKQIYILMPLKKSFENDEGEIVSFIYGFTGTPRYRKEDTIVIDEEKWLSSEPNIRKEEERLKNLPFREVVDEWGLSVESYNGQECSPLGFYRQGETIALGVKNLSTWTHEIIHAADHKLGTLNTSKSSHKDNEIVAELGGATLLSMIGLDHDADLGGAWEYINSYSNTPIRSMLSLTNRIGKCIQLVLETMEKYER